MKAGAVRGARGSCATPRVVGESGPRAVNFDSEVRVARLRHRARAWSVRRYVWIVFAACLVSVACSSRETPPVGPPPSASSCATFPSYPHVIVQSRSDGAVRDVAASDSLVFAAADSGVVVYDTGVVRPGRRSVVTDAGGAAVVGAAGTRGVAGFADGTVMVVDAGDPSVPVVTGYVHAPGPVRGVVLSKDGTTAYATVEKAGLAVVPIGPAGIPQLAGFENTPGCAVDAEVVGHTAYVADEILGLRIVDVSTPASPWLVATASVPGIATGVAVDDTTVWLAIDVAGVVPVSVADRFAPRVGTAVVLSAPASDVAVSRGTLWVADRFDGLVAFALSGGALTAPRIRIPTPSRAVRVVADGDIVAVADDAGGARVLRTPVVDAPPVDRLIEAGGDVRDVVPFGSGFAVVDYNEGLQLFGPPPAAIRAGTWSPPAGSHLTRVAVEGSTAVVAIDGGAVVSVDVSDSTAPVTGAVVPGSDNAAGITLDGGEVFIARGVVGISGWALDGSKPLRGVRLGHTIVTGVVADCNSVFAASRRGLWVINRSAFRVATRVGDTEAYEDVELVRDDSSLPLPTVRLYAAASSGPEGPGVRVWDVLPSGSPVDAGFAPASATVSRLATGVTILTTAVGGAFEIYAFDGRVPGARTALIPRGDPAAAVAVVAGWWLGAAGAHGLLMASATGCLNN